jgi:small-conductance mechanosensitive channel
MVSIVGENPYLQALIVAVGSLILGKLTDWIISRGISRIARRTRSEVDDKIIALLHWPVFATVVLLGLLLSFLIVSPGQDASAVAGNVTKTLVILIWIAFGIKVTNSILSLIGQEPARQTILQPTTRPLFETASKLFIIALGVYFVLQSWGVDPVGWIATAGIAAVAVGLAAQETLGNLFAGISILADAPYKIGDYIVLDGQERGIVTKIGLRSTRILTRDDVEVTVPNAVIARSKIVNESSGRWLKQRLRIPIGVAYGSDVELVKRVLVEAVTSQELIAEDPEPWVKFDGFGDSSLKFEIRCWIRDPAARGRAIDGVNTSACRKLAESGIEIPYPKRDVYIKELPGSFRIPSQEGKSDH